MPASTNTSAYQYHSNESRGAQSFANISVKKKTLNFNNPISSPSRFFVFESIQSMKPIFKPCAITCPGNIYPLCRTLIRAPNKVCIFKGRMHTGMFRRSRNAMEKMSGKKSPPSYTPIPVIIPTIC